MLSYNYKSLIKSGFSIITKSINNGESLGKISFRLRKLTSIPVLNKFQKAQIYQIFYTTARAARNYPKGNWIHKLSLRDTYDTVLRTVRRVDRELKLKAKKDATRAMLKSDQFIFYLCSVHDKPAEDHKNWQGLIYVDRYWRTKILGDMYYSVLSYIKNHNIKTIQWVMGDPVYMTTRPNCKHFFTPVDTHTVLHSSAKSLLERHRYKNYTPEEYYSVRSDVYSALNKIVSSEEFQGKIKR